MNQVMNGDVSRDSAVGATLGELAEKLSELREHLDQILARLSDSREDDGGIRDAAPATSGAASVRRAPRACVAMNVVGGARQTRPAGRSGSAEMISFIRSARPAIVGQ